MNFYNFFKKIAFRFDPELIHNFSISSFKNFPKAAKLMSIIDDKRYNISDSHTTWKFPVALAAGLDKNAEAIDFFNSLGFGAIEAGTVTPMSQAGNQKPRIWRYPEENTLRNAMGFPNSGAQSFSHNLAKSSGAFCLGINVGKNKDTLSATDDYTELIKKFKDSCHYLAVNISSPNTKNLRDLQSSNFLSDLKTEINSIECTTPIYIKVSPDMSKENIQSLTEKCIDLNYQGIISTNTTSNHNYDSGGMSGKYLKELAKEKRKEICEVTRGINTFSTIGVGGVDSAQDLFDFWKMGGDMMQIYTAFIFHGPGILHSIKEGIDLALTQYSLNNVTELREFFKKENQTS